MYACFRVAVRRLVPVSLALLSFTALATAGDVTLQWDPNTESDLAGYKVYYGTASGVYGTPIVIGLETTYTITGLPDGTYYFAVTAYNTAGLESGFSNEVSTTISGSTTSKCDLNADSRTDVLDLQLLINSILGSHPLTLPIGDLNGDGRVDVLDLQILGNVILGLRSCPS